MTEPEICWRCGLVPTRKRVDGKPVCSICFMADARANHGIVPSYADLTPMRPRTRETPSPPVSPKKPRPRKRKA